jgi:hypothetical protein
MNTVLINKAVCIILMQRLGRFAPISKKKKVEELDPARLKEGLR